MDGFEEGNSLSCSQGWSGRFICPRERKDSIFLEELRLSPHTFVQNDVYNMRNWLFALYTWTFIKALATPLELAPS